MVPGHAARRRALHVDGAGEADGAAALHVDVLGLLDPRLGRCNNRTGD